MHYFTLVLHESWNNISDINVPLPHVVYNSVPEAVMVKGLYTSVFPFVKSGYVDFLTSSSAAMIHSIALSFIFVLENDCAIFSPIDVQMSVLNVVSRSDFLGPRFLENGNEVIGTRRHNALHVPFSILSYNKFFVNQPKYAYSGFNFLRKLKKRKHVETRLKPHKIEARI